jgi:hypothetical protein
MRLLARLDWRIAAMAASSLFGCAWNIGERVYNPFDVLLYPDTGLFRPHWFETGTPSFLIELSRAYFCW